MKYYVDGYTIFSNPSKTGGGYTIAVESGTAVITKQILKEGFTNNEGELLAINEAAKLCPSKGEHVIVTDSKVMLHWLDVKHLAKSKRSRKDLDLLKMQTILLLKEKNIILEWKPREENLAGHYNEKTFNS